MCGAFSALRSMVPRHSGFLNTNPKTFRSALFKAAGAFYSNIELTKKTAS